MTTKAKVATAVIAAIALFAGTLGIAVAVIRDGEKKDAVRDLDDAYLTCEATVRDRGLRDVIRKNFGGRDVAVAIRGTDVDVRFGATMLNCLLESIDAPQEVRDKAAVHSEGDEEFGRYDVEWSVIDDTIFTGGISVN